MLDTPVSDLIDEYAKDHRVGLSALFDALLGATLGIQLEHVPCLLYTSDAADE